MAIDFNVAQMPYSLEAEQSVLGSIIKDPDNMNSVADFLQPSDFYIEKNARLFEVMSGLFLTNHTIDVVPLIEAMKQTDLFSEDESKAYILQLAEFVPVTKNIKTYADIVWQKSRQRQLILAAREIATECVDFQGDYGDLFNACEQKVYAITQGKASVGFPSLAGLLSELMAYITNLAENPDAERGIPTGFYDLDKHIGGLNKGNLVVLAASPGVGKTSLAMNIAQYVMQNQKKKVVFFSLEMSAQEILLRLLSALSGISSKRLSRGEFDEANQRAEWVQFAEAMDAVGAFKLLIDDNPMITVTEMKAKLRREKNVDLVVIDYLQLMGSGKVTENRVQEVSQITRGLKIMAKELNIPVLVLSQLHRLPEARKGDMPQLSDLRESGSIEQDADIVLMLARKTNANPGEPEYTTAKCGIVKNRHGSTGEVILGWNGELTQFTNLSLREE